MLFTKSHLQSSMKSVIFGVFCQYARISSPGKVQTVKWPVKLFSLAKNDLRTVFRPLLSTLNRPTIALYWQGVQAPWYLQAHDSNPALLGHLTVLTWGKTRVIFHQHIDVSMQIVFKYPTYTSLCVARASWHAKHDFLRHNQILEHFWDIARTCWQRRYSHNSLSAHAHFRWSSGDEEFNEVVEWTFWGCFAWSYLMVTNPRMLSLPNTYDYQI